MKYLLILILVASLLVVIGCEDDSPVRLVESTPTPTITVEEQTPTGEPTPTVTPSLSIEPTETPIHKPTPSIIGELQVHFIDVGQGDAILCNLGETEVLIDGGGRSPGITDYLQNHIL